MSLPLPEEFVSIVQQQLGDESEALLEALNDPPVNSIRLHPHKGMADFEDMEQIPWSVPGRFLKERPGYFKDPLWHAGAYYVQEASSMLTEAVLSRVMTPGQPCVALDLCASPGGKSTHLLSVLPEGSVLVSNEVIAGRLSQLRENLQRWGNPHVVLTNLDPSDMGKSGLLFDLIWVDAPCSGEGLFRKEPEWRAGWTLQNVDLCAKRQKRILSDILPNVKDGGILAFSTCTINDRENRDNAEYLGSLPGFEPVKLSFPEEWGIAAYEWNHAYGYQCFPHKFRGEGFFFSVFRKSGNVRGNILRTTPTRHWKKVEKAKLDVLKPFIADFDNYQYYENDKNECRAVPKAVEDILWNIANNVQVRSIGVHIGHFKNLVFLPSHDLAMSTLLSPDIPGIEVDMETARQYLKKASDIHFDKTPGWYMLRYKGVPLGWVKVLQGRTNNYYPMDWRLRKDI